MGQKENKWRNDRFLPKHISNHIKCKQNKHSRNTKIVQLDQTGPNNMLFSKDISQM